MERHRRQKDADDSKKPGGRKGDKRTFSWTREGDLEQRRRFTPQASLPEATNAWGPRANIQHFVHSIRAVADLVVDISSFGSCSCLKTRADTWPLRRRIDCPCCLILCRRFRGRCTKNWYRSLSSWTTNFHDQSPAIFCSVGVSRRTWRARFHAAMPRKLGWQGVRLHNEPLEGDGGQDFMGKYRGNWGSRGRAAQRRQ